MEKLSDKISKLIFELALDSSIAFRNGGERINDVMIERYVLRIIAVDIHTNGFPNNLDDLNAEYKSGINLGAAVRELPQDKIGILIEKCKCSPITVTAETLINELLANDPDKEQVLEYLKTL